MVPQVLLVRARVHQVLPVRAKAHLVLLVKARAKAVPLDLLARLARVTKAKVDLLARQDLQVGKARASQALLPL